MRYYSLINSMSRGGSSYDADAQAFLTATGITDLTISNAINDLVIGYKSEGLWTKRGIIYPIVGGTSTTVKYNLKNPLDTDGAFRLSLFGGITYASTGITPDGSTGYGNTHWLKPSDNISFGFYSRTEGNNTGYDISAVKNGSNGYNVLALQQTNTFFLVSNSVGNSQFSSAVGSSKGWFMTNFNGTAVEGFRNGTELTGTSSFPNSEQPNLPFKMFCLQYDTFEFEQFSNRECAFAVFGDNISEAEALAEYNLIQDFQTALSRNV